MIGGCETDGSSNAGCCSIRLFSLQPPDYDAMMHLILGFLLILNSFNVSNGFFSWMFSKEVKNTVAKIEGGNSIADQQSTEAVLAEIPFDLQIADEKFLNQAEPYLGRKMSALDMCQHRIVLGIHKSCSQLSEEDLAKLSVNLLNCQSAVEGRKIYPCTKDMTLKECTLAMDQDTWNSYHIISNRARALCYNLRQQQFTAKTEITVDRLMSSAQIQLDTMTKLKDGQEKLEHIAANTFDTLSTGHKELMDQQTLLKDSQRNVRVVVNNNLKELAREKALIASGHKELASMTETIKSKLADADEQLSRHDTERKESYKEVIEDLSRMRVKANDVLNQIDNGSRSILQHHLKTIEHYQEALDSLQRVNSSINEVLSLVERTRLDVDGKLAWITRLTRDAEGNTALMLTCGLHLGYFLLGAIGAVFLEAPYALRVVLLVTVPLNAFAEAHHGLGMDFLQLTIVVVSTSLSVVLVQVLVRWAKRRRNSAESSCGLLSLKKEAGKKEYEDYSTSEMSAEDSVEEMMISRDCDDKNNTSGKLKVRPRDCGNMPSFDQKLATARPSFLASDYDSPRMVLRSRSRDVTPIRSYTPPLVSTCSHINKKDQPCKLASCQGQEFCRIHSDNFK